MEMLQDKLYKLYLNSGTVNKNINYTAFDNI